MLLLRPATRDGEYPLSLVWLHLAKVMVTVTPMRAFSCKDRWLVMLFTSTLCIMVTHGYPSLNCSMMCDATLLHIISETINGAIHLLPSKMVVNFLRGGGGGTLVRVF